uniref:Uncharacterized protein n=1 Tax=Physcomitrium patens TaxID=3218 RepID=A0A7I4EHP1_PHYPA
MLLEPQFLLEASCDQAEVVLATSEH